MSRRSMQRRLGRAAANDSVVETCSWGTGALSCCLASHVLPNLLFWEAAHDHQIAKPLILNGTAAPARTGDPQIHNLVL